MNTLDLQKKRAKEVHNEAAKLRNNNAFAPAVDVCYILDCTGSMGPYISNAKNTIFDVNQRVKDEIIQRERKNLHIVLQNVCITCFICICIYMEKKIKIYQDKTDTLCNYILILYIFFTFFKFFNHYKIH